MEQLKELMIYDDPVDKDVEFPELERIEIRLCSYDNVLDYFTFAQFAQVKFLDAGGLRVDNMHLLQNLTTVQCGFHDTLTEDYPLPPNLVDLKIWAFEPVKGVPRQLKSFFYDCADKFERERTSDNYHVFARSDNLKRLVIKWATSVTIDCPNLTHLELEEPFKINVNLPSLTSLTYRSPEKHNVPFPLEQGFPKLQELNLRWLSQDVVFQQKMKSVELSGMNPNRLRFLADRVHLNNCEIPNDTDITARVFTSYSPITHGIKCKELRCCEIDQVPPMVEKLTLSLKKPSIAQKLFPKLRKPSHEDLIVPELRGCNVLTSLTIEDGFQHYQRGFPVPSSVKQLNVKDGIHTSSRTRES